MRVFNAFYYSFSPTFASTITSSPTLAAAIRLLLHPLIYILRASSSIFSASDVTPELGMVAVGVTASALLGIVYIGLPAMGIGRMIRKKSGIKRVVKKALS